MIYGNLLAKHPPRPAIKVGIIGAGNFATAIITQSTAIPHYEIVFVGDVNLDAAKKACGLTGWDGERFTVARTEAHVRQARTEGKVVITARPELLSACEMDVLVEATGDAEAGARYALEAFELGRHVVMVNKETDSVVGPILTRKSQAAGVIYTMADGDQPALIVALCDWARLLGLEVVAAGKSHDKELVIDLAIRTFAIGKAVFPLERAAADAAEIIRGSAAGKVDSRRAVFGDRIAVANNDRMEIVCVANATGLTPHVGPHAEPILRTIEIPEVLGLPSEGGILREPGVLETVCSLREPHTPSMGGGVFLVIRCENAYSREILISKGLIPNRAHTVAMIYRPYHLCGVETPISILSAAWLGVATGARNCRPHWDVVAVAKRELATGTALGRDLEYSDQLGSYYESNALVRRKRLLPLGMSAGLTLTRDIAPGTPLTQDMVEVPTGSVLWQLRREQDALCEKEAW